MKRSTIFGLIGATGLALYLWELSKEQAGKLDGLTDDVHIDLDTDRAIDSIAPWVDVNPIVKDLVKTGAKKVLRGASFKLSRGM